MVGRTEIGSTHGEEVREDGLPMQSHDAFGMKLNGLDRIRLVTDTLEHTVL